MKYKTVAIVLIVVFTILLMTDYMPAEISNDTEREDIYTQTRILMDTTVTLSVVSSDQNHAYEAIDNAFERMYFVEKNMNNYDNNSEVTMLNEQGFIYGADQEITNVIERSGYYYRVSGGAFDISIQSILDLWASKYSPGGTYQDPTSEEINQTLKLVNHSQIIVKGNNISLAPGMKITLGGIAKGYAVDIAIDSLKEDGISSGFVNAGGDGRYMGTRPDSSPWRVGLQNPEKSEDVITIIKMEDAAVATSGNYERYFSDTAKVSHIADPRTGYPSSNLISSTVVASTAMDADAFATSVFILGENKGMNMVEELDDVECLIITTDKRLIRSSGFSAYENN